MSALLSAAEWWSRTLWALSWQIGVLVGIVWLASLVFRRATPSFRYWLWCIVLIRMCIPVTLALPAGVSGDVRRAVETSAPVFLLAAQQTVLSPAASPPETGDSTPVAAARPDPERSRKTRVVQGDLPDLSLDAKLALGWTAVSLCLLLLLAVKDLRVRRILQGLPEVTRPELGLLVDSLRSRCSIGRPVRVRMFPAGQPSQGPAVVGVMHPTILLPAHVAEGWSIDELEPVLLHELAHIKRWDLLVNWVQMLVQAAYFFHPLVWFVNSRIRQECELVCDDLAVLLSGGQCKRYSRSFVRVLEETSNGTPSFEVAGVGMTERRKPLARRVIRMMGKDYRAHRPLGWLSIALLLIVSAAAVALAAERAADEAGLGPAASPEAEGVKPQREIELEGFARPSGGASVGGKVVDAETGQPVAGAMVMIVQQDAADAMAIEVAGDGSFEFKGIPGGQYMLNLNTAPDYVLSSKSAGWTPVSLGNEEQKRDVVFRLQRGFSIAGRITTEDGSPLLTDEAFVVFAWAEKPTEEDIGPRYTRAGQGGVVADGAYRIGGLDGRPVFVQFMDWSSELKDDPYPPVYSAGTFSRDEATRITFDGDPQTEIKNVDIVLRKTGGLVLEGAVSNRDTGEPIAEALVVVHHRDMMFDRATTYTDAQGRYRFECLGPGEFQVHADATPQGFVRTRKLVTLTEASPATQLDVTLMAGGSVSG